jgi:hypothetical protein
MEEILQEAIARIQPDRSAQKKFYAYTVNGKRKDP